MDDDGSKSLDFTEFRKGLSDYGMDVSEAVIMHAWPSYMPAASPSLLTEDFEIGFSACCHGNVGIFGRMCQQQLITC